MSKDYKGIFAAIGASNHSNEEREQNDYYATDPKALELLLELEQFDNVILEPACGEGHLSQLLIRKGYAVASRDLIDRGYGYTQDFLSDDVKEWNGDIITNPPYKYAKQFIEKALNIIPEGHKVAMLLRIQFLEGVERKQLFENTPPHTIYVSRGRLKCAKNGDFDANKNNGAICFAWFVWQKGYKGNTILKWFN